MNVRSEFGSFVNAAALWLQPPRNAKRHSTAVFMLIAFSAIAAVPQTQVRGQNNTDLPDAIEIKDAPLPKLEDLPVPTVQQLLQERPVDWIVVRNDEVLIVEPISIRPNAVETLQKQLDELVRNRPPNLQDRERYQMRVLRLRYLDVVLADDADDTVYQLNVSRYVKDIIYHEDLMLQRIGLLLEEGKLQQAFEMLIVLERRHPDWPGSAEARNRLLLLEARQRLGENQLEFALIPLKELHRRDRAFPGLSASLGQAIDRIISGAFTEQDYRRGRYFLKELTRMEPEHSVVAKWTNQFLAEAQSRLNKANAATSSDNHADALSLAEEAARIWPRTPNLRAVHRRAAIRWQRLKVGTVELASPDVIGPFESDANRRFDHLTRRRLFEIDRVDETAHYRTNFFEQWEPTDLGREIVFTLRPNRVYWESQQPALASTVISRLADRVDPASPAFDERFHDYVESIQSRSPFEFSVHFGRVPVRTEGLFAIPLATQHRNGKAAENNTSDFFKVLPTFTVQNQTADEVIFRRSMPEPDNVAQFHVGEIIEKRYDNYDQAVQGLLRGDVSMLPKLQPWDTPVLAQDDRFFVQRFGMPTSHVIQINPRSTPLINRELRRSLAYGLDREKLLRETVLRDPDARGGRLVSAPIPRSSAAYNPLVRPREHNLPVSIALAVAARKHFEGKIPELKLLCPSDPVLQATAKEMVKHWARIGITVVVLTPDQLPATTPDDAPAWDLVYRTVQLAEPIIDLWPLLTLEPRARVTSLTHIPDWLRQQLIAMDKVSDFDSAVQLCHKLHSQLHGEAFLFPLWEIDGYIVFRKNIRGFPQRPMHAYQDVERWIVEPWYALD